MTSVDDEGRIRLPDDVREQFGDEYRIVKLPDRVALLPVDDDPLVGLHEAVGDAFEGADREELAAEALEAVRAEVEREADGRH